MPAFRDEIFGPVLAVCEFESLDEALALGEPTRCTACRRPSTRRNPGDGPSVHRRHRGRSRARQRPHRLQGAVAAVWRRQAVGRGPAGEQRDRTGILRRSESRLRARLRPRRVSSFQARRRVRMSRSGCTSCSGCCDCADDTSSLDSPHFGHGGGARFCFTMFEQSKASSVPVESEDSRRSVDAKCLRTNTVTPRCAIHKTVHCRVTNVSSKSQESIMSLRLSVLDQSPVSRGINRRRRAAQLRRSRAPCRAAWLHPLLGRRASRARPCSRARAPRC